MTGWRARCLSKYCLRIVVVINSPQIPGAGKGAVLSPDGAVSLFRGEKEARDISMQA